MKRQHGVNARAIAIVIAVFAVVVVSVGVVTHILARGWDVPLAGANAPMNMKIDGAVLESAPQDERARYFAEKARLLDRYEWIDRKHGIARIPIEAAMQMLTEKPTLHSSFLHSSFQREAGTQALLPGSLPGAGTTNSTHPASRIPSIEEHLGASLPLDVELTPEAIQQKEVLVEARAKLIDDSVLREAMAN